jgi:ribonuclease Z
VRKVLRIGQVFVSHAHMDHFSGFDRLLRLVLRRDRRIDLVGPPGFIDRVEHKLRAYDWNLAGDFNENLVLVVHEAGKEAMPAAEFHGQAAFRRTPLPARLPAGGAVWEDEAFRVRAAVFDHGIPCLAFVLEEARRVAVIKEGLAALGLRVGPWLRAAKAAALRGEAGDTSIPAEARDGGPATVALGALGESAFRVVAGQRLGYVTDVGYTPPNVARLVDFLKGIDVLFIEAHFMEADADVAARTHHLTAAQAGRIARMAGVGRMVPFHHSPRYADRPQALRAEAERAFAGGEAADATSGAWSVCS